MPDLQWLREWATGDAEYPPKDLREQVGQLLDERARTADQGIADELEHWAGYFASLATECYPESVFPPPRLGQESSPDAYTAGGYRNAYRNVAGELRGRVADLRAVVKLAEHSDRRDV